MAVETGSRRTAGRVALAVGLTVVLVAGVVLLLRPDPEPAPQATTDPTTAVTSPPASAASGKQKCADSARTTFRPRRVTVEGVIDDAEVRALPRDGDNVPGIPPVSDKQVFAWDRPGIRPGAPRGNVLLNAHTWPDGSAVGNAMLRELGKGDRIVLRGGDRRLCYEVTRRVEVRAADGYPPYFDTDGPPQVAIVVCSGERTGPGEWTHRTLWFASPTA